MNNEKEREKKSNFPWYPTKQTRPAYLRLLLSIVIFLISFWTMQKIDNFSSRDNTNNIEQTRQ